MFAFASRLLVVVAATVLVAHRAFVKSLPLIGAFSSHGNVPFVLLSMWFSSVFGLQNSRPAHPWKAKGPLLAEPPSDRLPVFVLFLFVSLLMCFCFGLVLSLAKP